MPDLTSRFTATNSMFCARQVDSDMQAGTPMCLVAVTNASTATRIRLSTIAHKGTQNEEIEHQPMTSFP